MQIHHKYTKLSLILCVHALISYPWYCLHFSLSMNCQSDYGTIDGRIAGNRRPDIFQRSKILKISQSA